MLIHTEKKEKLYVSFSFKSIVEIISWNIIKLGTVCLNQAYTVRLIKAFACLVNAYAWIKRT